MTENNPIDHVTIRASDLAAGLELYTQVFDLLGFDGERHDGDAFHDHASRRHARRNPTSPIAFAADSREQIDAWWRALIAAGYPDDGAPGPRPEYGPDYYGAFIRIDHLWIGVRDLAATKTFYAAIAPVVGVHPRDRPDRLQVIADRATFSLLEGPPSENLHLAIGVKDKEAVAEFHRVGLQAGGRDNGGPGERPQYHPGYYAAYLRDPDQNSIEAVFHDRSLVSARHAGTSSSY